MAAIQRRELKRPDAFVTTGRRWLEWSITHQQTLAFAGAGLLVVVLLGAGAMRYGAVQERQANEDLAVALSAYKDGRWREAAVDLREVAERWDGRGVALVAQFYAAQADLEAGDLEAAGSAFEALSAQGGAPAYLRQQALVGLGYIAAEGDDDAGAARRYADAVAVGGPYTGPALLGEARARLALGEVDAAKALYERFLGEFPESPERAAVEQEVAGL